MFVLFSRMCSDKVGFCGDWKPGYGMRRLRIFGLAMIYAGRSLQISCQLEGSKGKSMSLIIVGKLDSEITGALPCFLEFYLIKVEVGSTI